MNENANLRSLVNTPEGIIHIVLFVLDTCEVKTGGEICIKDDVSHNVH